MSKIFLDKNQKKVYYYFRASKAGPLVKRLRHGPFTAEIGVRFPYGSSLQDSPKKFLGSLFF